MKVKEFVKIINGSTPSSKHPEYYGGNIIWITPKDLSDQKSKYINMGERTITEAGYKSCSAQIIPPNNVLMSSRAPIGLLAINTVECCTNQGFKSFIVDKSKCDIEYLYYYLKYHISEIEALGSGTTFKEVSKNSIENYEVFLPSLEVQKQVSKALSIIDSKIENNNRINSELESMAKTIYDYWFTQFDFPDENGKPYKSSGGKMVWNEELKREIPEGWGDTTLNRYIGRITNGLNPRKNFVLGSGQNYYVTIKSLTGNDINWEACDRCDDVALSKINARSQLQVGDVIFSAIGTIGRTFYIQEPPVNWNISETSFTVRPNKDVPADFFYALLNNDEIQIQADKKAMGSTLRCLVMDSFTAIPYIEIPCAIMQKFANVVKPMYNAIYKNNKQNRELTSIRDWLLPILMNGQVGFKEKTK